jgi:peptidoglycan-associated lipoprotein
MKKFFSSSILLLAAVCAVALTGCQSDAGAEDTSNPIGGQKAPSDPTVLGQTDLQAQGGSGFVAKPVDNTEQGKWQDTQKIANTDPDGWTIADPSGNRLNMPVIYFAYDSDLLVPSETFKLDKIAAYMEKNPSLAIIIEGHCDQRGTDEYNRALGERRANAIRAYLAGRNVANNRMRTVSYGKDKPALSGAGETNWRQNRRGVPIPMVMPNR